MLQINFPLWCEEMMRERVISLRIIIIAIFKKKKEITFWWSQVVTLLGGKKPKKQLRPFTRGPALSCEEGRCCSVWRWLSQSLSASFNSVCCCDATVLCIKIFMGSEGGGRGGN